MSIRKILLAATMLALPLAAQAQPVTGLYVAGALGVNWLSGVDTGTTSTAGDILGTTANYNFRFDAGWVGLASLGWGFGNGLRVEAEANFRENGVSGWTGTVFAGQGANPFGTTGLGGNVRSYGLMANVFYDFNLGPVMPYVGGGVGYAWTDWSANGVQTGDFAVRASGSGGAFAWQVMAGLAVPIRAVPGLAITAEYRYFAVEDVTVPFTVSQPRFYGQGNFSTGLANQSLLLGVRYNFGRAPAAPPPVAAPAPARSFIVFFDFNRHDLTARAREIVAQAAAAARSQQVTRIEVAGHTDTVGSAQYNLGLSQRRANTVAAELVRLGVPREAISTAGYGFSRPLVPTGPNVREPQNRRVEIVFR